MPPPDIGDFNSPSGFDETFPRAFLRPMLHVHSCRRLIADFRGRGKKPPSRLATG
jgi:hypothetical protein